jgi:formylglycine-generating enzyme required for sulfatase activity
VTLTKPYYIGKFEVTQEQYEQIMGDNQPLRLRFDPNPSYFKGRNLPVEQVSWHEAQAFCRRASEKTGLGLRLPTDAEWEHACRAGTRTTYYTGDTEADLDRAGWYDKNSNGTTHPVGQRAPNAWGVYDMHGSVWEWCGDWYEEHKAEAAVDPQGPGLGQGRVLRGGSWDDGPGDCRSAYRAGPNAVGRSLNFGFRVVGSP